MTGAMGLWIGSDASDGDVGLGPGTALMAITGAGGMVIAVWSLLDTALGPRLLGRLAVSGGLAGAAAFVGLLIPPAEAGVAWHEVVFASRDDFTGAPRAGTYVTMFNLTMGLFLACLLVVFVAGLASGRPFGVWAAVGGGGPVVWTVFANVADIGAFGLLGGGARIEVDVHPFTPITTFVFVLMVIAALTLVAPAGPSIAPAWMADPTGRHQFRYWNGRTWTSTVADDGVIATDQLPIVVPAAVGVPPPPAG